MAYAFDGYMRMYAKTPYSKISRTQYTEDWADEHKRKKIMGKRRKYIITIYLYNTSGDHIVETTELDGKGDQEILGSVIHHEINRMMKENPEQEFDLINTYINIRV